MNYLQKIALLEKLINEAQSLNVQQSSAPIFQIWKDDVHQALKQIYGEKSFEYERFVQIQFSFYSMIVVSGVDYAPHNRKAFQDGMKEAIEYLNIYKSRINKEDNRVKEAIESNKQISNHSDTQIKKIFISHASKDKEIVEELIELLEQIGVEPDQIFCSSFEGYGIPLGENFLETIKAQLTNDSLVLFVLTENFYQSAVCMCEMGAVWVLSKKHIPIVVPPLGYADIRGVIPNTQGLEINNAQKWNSLKQQIETQFQINGQENSAGWERKRDRILGRINKHIADVKN